MSKLIKGSRPTREERKMKEPKIIKTVTNVEDNMQAIVRKDNIKAYVSLFDLCSGEYVNGTTMIFPLSIPNALEMAFKYADTVNY